MGRNPWKKNSKEDPKFLGPPPGPPKIQKIQKFGPVSQAGHRGKGKVNHKEESRFLGESKTPFGDFLRLQP